MDPGKVIKLRGFRKMSDLGTKCTKQFHSEVMFYGGTSARSAG
jgi:hypothetical protein